MSFNINDVPNNANTYLPVTPVIPGMLLITDISRSYPMIVSFTDSDENTYIVGQVVVLTVPATYGMVQANGNQGKILQVVGTNLVLDIDSRGYDRFVVPSGVKVTQPASLAPGGSRNLQFSNLTNIEPFQSITGIIASTMALQFNKRVYSTAGTYSYVPTSGMSTCIVEVVGGGAGGGGAFASGAAQAAGGGGGGGAYACGVFSSSQIGSSQTLIVGLGGIAGDNTGGNGGNGNSSSFGSLISCSGGNGGFGRNGDNNNSAASGGTGGTASGSGVSYSIPGFDGDAALWVNTGGAGLLFITSGAGANSILGKGGSYAVTNGAAGANGNAGIQGGGGSGAILSGAPGAAVGGAGGDGIIIITEFIV
jgi:hypothetical protein